MDSLKNAPLQPGAGQFGDELMQQVQDQLDARRKTGDAVKNPLALGDMTQSSLGMAAQVLGFGSPGGAGGPLAKTLGLI